MLIGCIIWLGWVGLYCWMLNKASTLVWLLAMYHYYHKMSDSPPEWKHVTPSHGKSQRQTNRQTDRQKYEFVPPPCVCVCASVCECVRAYMCVYTILQWQCIFDRVRERERGGGAEQFSLTTYNYRPWDKRVCNCRYPIVHSVFRCPSVQCLCVSRSPIVQCLCVSRCPIVHSVCVFLDALLFTLSVCF